jgi:MYND finger
MNLFSWFIASVVLVRISSLGRHSFFSFLHQYYCTNKGPPIESCTASHSIYVGMTPWYNPAFADAHGNLLIAACQASMGCFECGAKNAEKRCSRCQIAIYCSKTCQKSDWKKNHKVCCGVYMDNKEPQTPGDRGSPVPVLLTSIGLMGEEDFCLEMQYRLKLFLIMASESQEKPVPMAFACAIVPMFRKLRWIVEATFWDDETRVIRRVPQLVVEPVESDQAALEAFGEQTLDISEPAFDAMAALFANFFVQLEEAGIETTAITCGKGIGHRLEELEAKLKARGGTHPPLLPSTSCLF